MRWHESGWKLEAKDSREDRQREAGKLGFLLLVAE